jgi:hypothetical protein
VVQLSGSVEQRLQTLRLLELRPAPQRVLIGQQLAQLIDDVAIEAAHREARCCWPAIARRSRRVS